MADVYLSIGALSTTPYYLSGLGVNIYSMDELCFYLVRDTYILDADLIDLKLCDYIEEQLKLPSIAEQIRELISQNAAVGEMVTTLLEATGYCDEEEIKAIRRILVDNASLSFTRKRKLRGDNLVKAGKFSRAIEEYQYILSNMEKDEEPELKSAIYHNIASAYAQMFMFDKVITYYKKAYETDGSQESLILYLAATRMRMKGEDFERMVVRCGYEDNIVYEAQKRLSLAENSDLESVYEEEMRHIINLKGEGATSVVKELQGELLDKWKHDYRRSVDAGYI